MCLVVLSNMLDTVLYLQDQNYVFYLFFEGKYNKRLYTFPPNTHTHTHTRTHAPVLVKLLFTLITIPTARSAKERDEISYCLLPS
jgi:hypothetical protein